jgi:uroporphyrinogen-III synthase
MEELSHDERGHLNHIGLFSIGPLTTRVLSHYGLTPRREADQPSLRRLAEAVRDYFAGGADSGLV